MSASAAPSERGGRWSDVRGAATTLFAERGYLGTSMKDIAAALGLRAPSLYNHVGSKQELLVDIMTATMTDLIEAHRAAVASSTDVAVQLSEAMGAHVRYHARNPEAVRIGNAELWHLEEPSQSSVRALRHEYEKAWQSVISRGVRAGRFRARSVQLTSFALLEMGIGVSLWYRPGGRLSEDELARHYGEMALRLVEARA